MTRVTTGRRFWVRRLTQMALVVLGIGTVNVFLPHLAPGDAAQVLAGESGSATPECLAALRRQFGLDQPLPVQFGHYLLRLATFDLGFSYRQGLPVATLILDRPPAALLAEIVRPGDPLDMVAAPFLWPGTEPDHPLGTDMLGRDLAAGLLHGARVSLLIGVVATVITLGIGVGAGALAGFYRGRLDQALMRTTELFQAIPPFLFALAIVAVLQPSLATITFAIGVTVWPSLARIVRVEVLALRDGEMVQAAASRRAARASCPSAIPCACAWAWA